MAKNRFPKLVVMLVARERFAAVVRPVVICTG